MTSNAAPDIQPVAVRLSPLFEARWSYEEFVRVMPFGPGSEGQAYAFSVPGQITGDALSGTIRLFQYPRVRVDGALLPDARCLIVTNAGEQVVAHAGGYVLPAPDTPGAWTIAHWMRFWTDAPSLVWLNRTLAFGAGTFADEQAHVRYFTAAPAASPAPAPTDAPRLDLLGTARWEYPEYESVRPFGDTEGIGFATSMGSVSGGTLAGEWRGWHYPSYLRDGLYQIDAHAEIRGEHGVILNRHGGLATRPPDPSSGTLYDIVQYATFVTESPSHAHLNNTLALGVGVVHPPGIVTVSYYGGAG